jgi:hypothetical protein
MKNTISTGTRSLILDIYILQCLTLGQQHHSSLSFDESSPPRSTTSGPEATDNIIIHSRPGKVGNGNGKRILAATGPRRPDTKENGEDMAKERELSEIDVRKSACLMLRSGGMGIPPGILKPRLAAQSCVHDIKHWLYIQCFGLAWFCFASAWFKKKIRYLIFFFLRIRIQAKS